MKFEKVADLIKYLQQFNPEAEVLTEMDFSYFKKPLHTNENSIKTSTPGIFIYGSYKLDVGLVSTIKDEDNKIVSTEILKKDLISNAYTNIMKYIEKNIVSKYPTFTRAYMVMNECDGSYDIYIKHNNDYQELHFTTRHNINRTIYKLIHDYSDSQGYPPEILQHTSIFITLDVL